MKCIKSPLQQKKCISLETLKKTGIFLSGTLFGLLSYHFIKQYNHSLCLNFGIYKKFKDILTTPYKKRHDIPEYAPEHCPGTDSSDAGKTEACKGCPNQDICSSGAAKVPDPKSVDIFNNLKHIKKKVLVLSGKGGVGKSTVTTQLAWLLQERGYNVGLMDTDICGPSIPLMTGSRKSEVHCSADGWSPIYVESNFSVMSIGFLISDEDEAVIWRGPKKNGLIRQFLTDVNWGPLDILLIDTPPGTSDEHLSIVTYLKEVVIDGALIVTTPQQASLMDVRKEIMFCKRLNIPVLGLIENMTDSVFDIAVQSDDYKDPNAIKTCELMDIPYAGKISLDQSILIACEKGISVSQTSKPESELLESFKHLVNYLVDTINLKSTFTSES